MLSFLLAGTVCVLVALCYSELAAMVPVSGSAYTCTYATLGEGPAFLVGWNLLLEFVISGAGVAIGWSGSLISALDSMFGSTLPAAITTGPSGGGIVNLPVRADRLRTAGNYLGRADLGAFRGLSARRHCGLPGLRP